MSNADRYLLDTNIILRLDPTDPQHTLTLTALSRLRRQKAELYITAQNLIELRNVATRPVKLNGFGLTASEADQRLLNIESLFMRLPEVEEIYLRWRDIVANGAIEGKQVHDARLVAVAQVHKCTHMLTYNMGHMQRIAKYIGVVVVDPASL